MRELRIAILKKQTTEAQRHRGNGEVRDTHSCLSKIERLAGSEPRLGLSRALGAALGAFAGHVHASVDAIRPRALRRPSGASPSLIE